MKPQTMWAVVGPSAMYPVLSVNNTKQGAKNAALAAVQPASKWSYCAEYLGWRVVKVEVREVE